MANIAATGKRAIMCTGLTAVTETCLPDLLARFYSEEDFSITISSRELVRLSLDHMEPCGWSLFWDSTHFNPTPSQLYWNVPEEGILARWFQLTPLMVYPRKKLKSFSGSSDSGDLILRACPNRNEIHIASDSDEIFTFAVRTPHETYAPNKSSAVKVARWAAGTTNRHNRWFLKHKLRIHYADVSERWEQVERESDKIVDTILLVLKFRIIFFLINWKASLRKLRWDITHTRLGRAAVNVLKGKRAA